MAMWLGGPCENWYLGGFAANLRTKTLDFRGFDSSRILNSRGGILMSIGNIPEVLSSQNWYLGGCLLLRLLVDVCVWFVCIVCYV